MSRLCLHVPELNEFWYRKKLMEDPETMSYNRGYDLDFAGYDKGTGCIAFPEEEWESCYNYFVGHEPERFYAYLVNTENGEFVGEVNAHKSVGHDWYDMGIVIEAKHRGKGACFCTMHLLIWVQWQYITALKKAAMLRLKPMSTQAFANTVKKTA